VRGSDADLIGRQRRAADQYQKQLQVIQSHAFSAPDCLIRIGCEWHRVKQVSVRISAIRYGQG
jgi:hypothetical protein